MVCPTNRLAVRRRQKGDRRGDFVRFAEPSERQLLGLGLPPVLARAPSTSGVLIGPGATALTRTPRPLTSRASDLVMPMIAALAAL